MISTLTWVPRGASKRTPIRVELSADEEAAVRRKADDEAGISDSEDGSSDDGANDDLMNDPAFASLRDVELPPGSAYSGKGGKKRSSRARGAGAAAAAMADSEEEDGGAPELGEQPAPVEGDDDVEADDDGSDAGDLVLGPHDAVIVVANTEEEQSSLEVHCYNEADGALYVHHDLTLPSYPLCLAWTDYAGVGGSSSGSGSVGSYCAVGTFKPDIEIWNLDVLDPLEPALTLRGVASTVGSKTKKKKKAAGGAGAGDAAESRSGAGGASGAAAASQGHSDAVMGLSWNRVHRHLLASSSADHTVKVWDLEGGGRVLHTYTQHKGKVQGVAWNPIETSIIATASLDRTATVTDARAADKSRIARYALPAHPESVCWNPHAPASLLTSCEDGSIICYDCRVPDKPLWLLKAHSQSTTAMAIHPGVSGLLATASLDKSVKIWDMGAGAAAPGGAGAGAAAAAAAPGAPTLVATKTMTIGQIFTASFFPNHPFLLAAGGSKGMLAVWDIAEDGGLPAPGAAKAPAAPAEAAPGMPADASATARRFAGRILEPSKVPQLGLRLRDDPQPLKSGSRSSQRGIALTNI